MKMSKWFWGLRNYILLENKLMLISINFTLKTSHSCLKKWYTMFSRLTFLKQSSEHTDHRHETNDKVHTSFFRTMFHTQRLHGTGIFTYMYSPENSHVPLKSMVGRCISYWNSPFLGDMFVFGGVPEIWAIHVGIYSIDSAHVAAQFFAARNMKTTLWFGSLGTSNQKRLKKPWRKNGEKWKDDQYLDVPLEVNGSMVSKWVTAYL